MNYFFNRLVVVGTSEGRWLAPDLSGSGPGRGIPRLGLGLGLVDGHTVALAPQSPPN
ncbi:MAG: hypothetical protein ACYDH9_02135 [Limisphaerales bacterium]